MKGPKPKVLSDRLWSKVPDMPGDDCWLWTGATASKSDYGVLGIGSMKDGSRGMEYAHRLSYMLCRGAIPNGMLVMHACDTPRCVNPSHLSVGTEADNLQDASRKGRCNNQNIGKVVCVHGHPFTAENTYTKPNGKRVCKTCRRASDRRDYYADQIASSGL